MAHEHSQTDKKKSIEENIHFLETKSYLDADLGVTYQPQKSVFKLWAPVAKQVRLKLYESGDIQNTLVLESYSMEQVDNIWFVAVEKDLEGFFYTYEVLHDEAVEVVDLYAHAVGVNGDRGAILDLSVTNPQNWDTPYQVAAFNDAYIWEVHVADFSASPSSGVSEGNRGKYLAFTEKETTLFGKGEVATGVQHLKQLGVNYVHLLPVFDHDNIETDTDYNWGYNPKNYNVPDGRYVSDPYDPKVRIREFKAMVQALHEENIGVVMDVVYNHTSQTETSWFNLTVPNYYYRQDSSGNFSDGSACGNEVASERTMVRKYIVDSVLFWAQEYKIDGFRFDLMGLIDVETMNQVRQVLNDAGLAHVLVYGEPWDAGSNGIQPPHLPANKQHTHTFSEGIAVFNDDLRDHIKGDVFEERDGGFVQGMNGKDQKKRSFYDHDLALGIRGNLKTVAPHQYNGWAENPSQVVAYMSVHDNLSLWDKLVITTSNPKHEKDYQRRENLVAMNKLAAAILFTSQGAVETQAGEEFCRTKFGDENSYVSPIEINQINWENLVTFRDVNAFYRGMWQIRQAYPPLRDKTIETAQRIQISQDHTENLIAYTIPNVKGEGPWKQMAVVLNSHQEPKTLELLGNQLPKRWQIIADTHEAGIEAKGTIEGNLIEIGPQSLLVLVEE